MTAMAQEIYVAHRGGIGVYSMAGEKLRAAPLAGAGALCVSGAHIFCAAEEERAILRLNRHTLTPEAVFSGGPGVSQLMTSADGRWLYALCAEADSVLMLDAVSGMPMIVCRVGCNPQQMALRGDMLAIAGGESGCVHLLDAHTLDQRGCLPMPGPVYSVDMDECAVYALCMTPALDALLVTQTPERSTRIAIEGMPGRMLRLEERLLVSAHMRLYDVGLDGGCILRACAAPGRAAGLIAAEGKLFFVDMLGERLLLGDGVGAWRLLCTEVKDAVVSLAQEDLEQKIRQ
ncbi:MAG: hypothetical protein IKU73_02360 [Clostridia bacterium]|nr:hypothetical protein [Clostridia bacterium]